MRAVLITAVICLSLARFDRQRAKTLLRGVAVVCMRYALEASSRPYHARPGSTVVFAPHQDDETMGCGGLIARKRNAGLPVHVIFITDGSASHPTHPSLAPAEIAALRLQEARAALRILGVESIAIHFLDERDGTLAQLAPARREALVAKIAARLQELKPTEIFLPCRPDGSSEHEAAFGFVVEAVGRTESRPTIWEYPVWSWWNPVLLLKRVLAGGERVKVPTEDYGCLKDLALGCYRSQTDPLPPQLEPVLPREFTHIFRAKAEYFFAFKLPPEQPVPRALPNVI